MNLDFLEIGTSNFETLLQTCKDTDIGMSVEPLKFYLDDLPDRPNVTKINAAITHNKSSNFINIFYIPPQVINEHKLPDWFKGCNTIGNYHPLHVQYNVKQFVNILEVPLLNVNEFMETYNIKKIKFLKIDTEGHDTIIMKGLFEYLTQKGKDYYPSKIQFESNENSTVKSVDEIISLFTSLGYRLVSRNHDTLFEY